MKIWIQLVIHLHSLYLNNNYIQILTIFHTHLHRLLKNLSTICLVQTLECQCKLMHTCKVCTQLNTHYIIIMMLVILHWVWHLVVLLCRCLIYIFVKMWMNNINKFLTMEKMRHDNNNNPNPAKILHVTRYVDHVELNTTMGIDFNFPYLVCWKMLSVSCG